MEQLPTRQKSRIDLINDIKRAAFILASSADMVRGNDDEPVTKEQYIRLQTAQEALGLAVTSLRLHVSPSIESKNVQSEVNDEPAILETPEIEDEGIDYPSDQLSA